jgi:hypothetical protein
VKFNARDFPEHGVSLIVPSDPSFGDLLAKLEPPSIPDRYSVFLKNSSTRSVVGYSIKWQCFDDRGETVDRNLSNDRQLTGIVSWVFLHGEEPDRIALLNRSEDIIKPHSIWLLNADRPVRPLEGPDSSCCTVTTFSITVLDESGRVIETTQDCASMTVIADGIFFDDGTFIGPDTIGFFAEVKSQMDARYEIFRGVQNDLESGKKADEIFKELQRIRDLEGGRLPGFPAPSEFYSSYRGLFARDVLGMKEIFGVDRALEDVQLKLSKPWVTLRKL